MAITQNITIQRAEEKDFPYIKEKLKNYILDDENTDWSQFFVAQQENSTVGFGRIIDHGKCFEIASLGVDYYHRKKGIGNKLVSFLIDEAKKLNPKKPVYIVTHKPDFFQKSGFKAIKNGPKILMQKKRDKCKLNPLNSKVMKK